VVKGSKAPGSIINPGVAPGSDVDPVAVVIRSPAGSRFTGKPDVAVFGNRAPASVFVQVFVADDVVGNVTGGDGVIRAAFPLGAPIIKIVGGVIPAFDVGVNLVGAREGGDFTRMNGVSGAAAGDFTLSFADKNDSGVAGFVDVDLVTTGTEEAKGEIRSVDFEGFIIGEPPDADVQRAL